MVGMSLIIRKSKAHSLCLDVYGVCLANEAHKKRCFGVRIMSNRLWRALYGPGAGGSWISMGVRAREIGRFLSPASVGEEAEVATRPCRRVLLAGLLPCRPSRRSSCRQSPGRSDGAHSSLGRAGKRQRG